MKCRMKSAFSKHLILNPTLGYIQAQTFHIHSFIHTFVYLVICSPKTFFAFCMLSRSLRMRSFDNAQSSALLSFSAAQTTAHEKKTFTKL